MTIQHCDTMLGAVTTDIQHCNVQFGKTWNAATLSQSQISANGSFGTAPNHWSCADTNEWARPEFKLTPLDSRGSGNMRLTVYVVSGAANKIVLRSGYYHNPDLTSDTSSDADNISAGDTIVMTGSGGVTYQEAYFCPDIGWASYNIACKITKVEWQVSTQGYHTVWEERLAGNIKHCDVRFG